MRSTSTKAIETRSSDSRQVDWIGLGLGATLLATLIFHWPGGLSGLALVQDDFFYYQKIAAAIVSGHGSTFNGIVPTNGYHPLWMLVLVVLNLFIKNLESIIAAVYVIVACATVVTYVFARKIFRLFAADHWLSDLSAATFVLLCFSILQTGMEIVLTIPLATFLIYRLLSAKLSNRNIFVTALVAAFVVLSRLDSIIWIGLLGVSLSLRKPRFSVQGVLWMALGFAPLWAYFIFDKIAFGTILPVSGHAKQLRTSHGLSLIILHSFHDLSKKEELIVVLTLIGFTLAAVQARKFRSLPSFPVLFPTLIFPLVHFITISILSDWPVWSWYFYSWALADVATFALLLQAKRPWSTAEKVIMGVFCVAACLQLIGHRQRKPESRVLGGVFLQKFNADHHGIFAMGDRAGIAGVLMTDPIIQTEGLVMDESYLDHLKNQEPLLSTLSAYRVRYYVANFYGGGIPTGCFMANEPSKAGPTAKHIESKLCMPPVATFSDGETQLAIYDLKK